MANAILPNSNVNSIGKDGKAWDAVYATSLHGTADSANKINTNAGSATQPVYFSNGVPVATSYSVAKSVPSDAKFTDTTYGAATQSVAGLMSSADKTKLDGIASGANAYSHPTSSGNKHIPSGGQSGQILRWSADGTAAWGSDNNTTYSAATQSAAGLMSASDKTKLDGIASGANAYSHPNTVTAGTVGTSSATSGSTIAIPYVTYNANGHVTGAGTHTHTVTGFLTSHQDISGKANTSGTYSGLSVGYATSAGSAPASDVYSWAKASSKPSYAWSEITSKPSAFTPASHTHDYAPSYSYGTGDYTAGSTNLTTGKLYFVYE